MKKWLLAFTALLVFIVIAATLTFTQLSKQLNKPLGIANEPYFIIQHGHSSYKVLSAVNRASDNKVPTLIGKLWLKYEFSDNTVKAGIYDVNPSMSLVDLFELFSSGTQKQFSIALIEGLTWKEWLTTLRNHEYIQDDFNADSERELLVRASKFFKQDIVSLEGVLLADTYYFEAGTRLSEIAKRAFLAMQNMLVNSNPNNFFPENIKSQYEVLIMASIVEKETAAPEERPLIAGVFINRLGKKMRLQTDPTIIYGLGEEFDGNITLEHKWRPTLYNTYVIKGLPPTPIAMFGREAIEAVQYPSITEYLFFVSKGNGTHFFSETLKQHNAAVRKYQLGKN